MNIEDNLEEARRIIRKTELRSRQTTVDCVRIVAILFIIGGFSFSLYLAVVNQTLYFSLFLFLDFLLALLYFPCIYVFGKIFPGYKLARQSGYKKSMWWSEIFFLTVGLIPLVEEVLFRCLPYYLALMFFAKYSLGMWVIMIIAAFLFAISHMTNWREPERFWPYILVSELLSKFPGGVNYSFVMMHFGFFHAVFLHSFFNFAVICFAYLDREWKYDVD